MEHTAAVGDERQDSVTDQLSVQENVHIHKTDVFNTKTFLRPLEERRWKKKRFVSVVSEGALQPYAVYLLLRFKVRKF